MSLKTKLAELEAANLHKQELEAKLKDFTTSLAAISTEQSETQDVLKLVELSGKKKNCEASIATVTKDIQTQERKCKQVGRECVMLQNSFNYYTLQQKSVTDKYNQNQKDIRELRAKKSADADKKIM